MLEINSIYKFKIVERGINTEGKKFSILQDENMHTHYYPKNIKSDYVEFKILEKSYTDNGKVKYLFGEIRQNYISDSSQKNKLKIYPMKFIKIETDEGESPSVNTSRMIVEDINSNKIYKIDIFSWQLYNGYAPDIVLCEGKKIGNDYFNLQQSLDNLQHPLFQKLEEYEFEYIRDINTTEGQPKFILARGLDNWEHKLRFPFNSEITSKLKYIYNGINKSGNLIFRQFVPFEKIVKYRALKRLTYNKFRDVTDNYIISKMFEDYDNKQNLWILSFCNILEEEFTKSIKTYEFEQALIYIEVLIEFENWILSSGFIDTFRENEILEVNKLKLIDFEQKKVSLELILNNEFNQFLKNITHNQLLQNGQNIKIGLNILNFTYNSYISIEASLIIDLLYNLGLNNFYNLNQQEGFQLFIFLQKLTIDSDKSIFEPIFTNGSKRDKYFVNNQQLYVLIKLALLNVLINKDYNSEERLLLSFIKFLRYKSLFIDIKPLRLHLIKTALYIGFNNNSIKTLLNILTWQDFDRLINIEDFKKYTFKTQINKLVTLTSCYELEQEVKSNILEEDVFGYKVNIFGNSGILPKKWIHHTNYSNFRINPTREVDVLVSRIDEYFGNILLSRKQINYIIDEPVSLEIGKIISGYVKRIEDYGIFIDFGEFDGLLHNSEIGYNKGIIKVGDKLEVKVLTVEIDENKTLVGVSQKQHSSLTLPIIDNIYPAYITNITEFGVFITTNNNVSGLVRKENISHQDIFNLDCCKLYDQVDVKLIRKRDKDKYEFCIKSASANPFIDKSNYLDQEFKGRITEVSEGIVTVSFYNYMLIGYHIVPSGEARRRILEKIKVNDVVIFKIVDINPENQSIKIDIDLSTIIKHQFEYNSENIDNHFLLEIGNCYEHFAYLLHKNSERLNYLNWAMHFYGMASSPKSYYLDLFINYQSLINRMTLSKSNHNELDIVIISIIDEAKELILEIKNQNLTIQIFPTLNLILNTLEILTCFGVTDTGSMKFLFETSELEDNEFEIIQKAAKLVLSYNLTTNVLNDNNLKFERWKQLSQYLKEGLLIIETEDEKDIKLRLDLLKLIKEGENHTSEFKASIFKPVHDAKIRSIIQNFENQLLLATENNDADLIELYRNKILDMQNASSTKGVRHTAMKNLVAFANSEGGNLIIGLEDDLNILGIEYEVGTNSFDSKKQDIYMNDLDGLISSYIGTDFHQCISSADFVRTEDGHLLWIKVKKSNRPIFLKLDKNGQSKKEFYIRGRVSARHLDIEEFTRYYSENFVI